MKKLILTLFLFSGFFANSQYCTFFDFEAKEPEMVALLTSRMERWIAKREAETGFTTPMYTQENWHGNSNVGTFKTSQEAYETLFIGAVKDGERLQAGEVNNDEEE